MSSMKPSVQIMVSYLNVVPLIKHITLINIVCYALFLLLQKFIMMPLYVENEVKYFIVLPDSR